MKSRGTKLSSSSNLKGLNKEAIVDLLRKATRQLQYVHSINDSKIYVRKILDAAIHGVREYSGRSSPVQLKIEPTNICNADCISCSTKRARRGRGNMPIDLFKKIIDDASQLRVRSVALYIHGEPLLHPQIGDMLSYIKEKGIAFYIRTNGSALSGRKAEEILSAGVDFTDHVTVSILGLSKQVHEKVMGKIQHEKVVENVLRFIEMRNERGLKGPILDVIFYEMPENKHEKEAFVDYWSGKVDRVLMGETSVSFANYNSDKQPTIVRTHSCSEIRNMWVLWNGDVTLCYQDINGEYNFGNLEHQSISEVWNSDKLVNIRQSHKRKEFSGIPICSHCG